MSVLGRALRVPPARRVLALQALVLIWAFHAALQIVPFAWLRPVPRALARVARRRAAARPLADFVWAAAVAGRRVPRATCLARALAVHALLVLHGHPANVQIGVARGATGEFEAHAWVECGTTIVVGGDEATRFTRLAGAR